MKLIEDEKCPRCGSMFACSKSAKCWCYEIDVPVSVIDIIDRKYNSCLCPDCLNEVSKHKLMG